MQVFICYSRSDSQFAAQLADDLADYDLIVWMDVRSIPTGANWDAEVEKGLNKTDIMLVLLSPASVASQNVADEWSFGIEHSKAIIPILVIPCEVPFRLSRRQRVDFTTDYRTGLHDLLRALGSPALRDPDSTQRIRVASNTTSVTQAAPTAAPVSKSDRPAPRPTGPQAVGIKIYPVVWSDSYNWFNGMGTHALQGEAMINSRELKLVPETLPVVTIPMKSIVSVTMLGSLDHYLKVTFYNKEGAFRSLALMGVSRSQRQQISEEIRNLFKLVTGRSLT